MVHFFWQKPSWESTVYMAPMVGACTWHACQVTSVMFDSATLWTIARQAPLSMGFSRQEYWSGLSFPSPGDLPDPDIKPRPPALQTDDSPTKLWGKPNHFLSCTLIPRSPNPGQTFPGSRCSIFLSRAELSPCSPIKDWFFIICTMVVGLFEFSNYPGNFFNESLIV